GIEVQRVARLIVEDVTETSDVRLIQRRLALRIGVIKFHEPLIRDVFTDADWSIERRITSSRQRSCVFKHGLRAESRCNKFGAGFERHAKINVAPRQRIADQIIPSWDNDTSTTVHGVLYC